MRGRHRIAEYTTEKNTVCMRRITPPSTKERPQAYIRTPIDFAKYDGIGKGFFYGEYTDEAPRYTRPTVPLSLSSISGDFHIIPRVANGKILCIVITNLLNRRPPIANTVEPR